MTTGDLEQIYNWMLQAIEEASCGYMTFVDSTDDMAGIEAKVKDALNALPEESREKVALFRLDRKRNRFCWIESCAGQGALTLHQLKQYIETQVKAYPSIKNQIDGIAGGAKAYDKLLCRSLSIQLQKQIICAHRGKDDAQRGDSVVNFYFLRKKLGNPKSLDYINPNNKKNQINKTLDLYDGSGLEMKLLPTCKGNESAVYFQLGKFPPVYMRKKNVQSGTYLSWKSSDNNTIALINTSRLDPIKLSFSKALQDAQDGKETDENECFFQAVQASPLEKINIPDLLSQKIENLVCILSFNIEDGHADDKNSKQENQTNCMAQQKDEVILVDLDSTGLTPKNYSEYEWREVPDKSNPSRAICVGVIYHHTWTEHEAKGACNK